ncbi:MAG: ankyrin repeat domain-containing protein [Candidatus Riflebacteria bacterium]|nr:ankyrin repeat domain-containing protein [Candidatus Riflebacteria bacterium]
MVSDTIHRDSQCHNVSCPTQLMEAARHQGPLEVAELIKNGADANTRDSYEWTALMHAASNNCNLLPRITLNSKVLVLIGDSMTRGFHERTYCKRITWLQKRVVVKQYQRFCMP